MSMTKKEFLELAGMRSAHSVSLYFPTTEQATSTGDMITLKDLLKEARTKLGRYELSRDEITDILKPVEPLLESSSPWRGLSEGMAVFIYGGDLKYWITDIAFERTVHVSDALYLLPLVNLVERFQDFYILRLSMREARLFRCDQHDISEVHTGKAIPQNLTEVVGADYEQKSLQYRSGQQAEGEGAMFHGHGSGDESEQKDEALRFVRAVGEGVHEVLEDRENPLVVACVEYLFPMFQDVCNYPNLVHKALTGNYEDKHPKTMRTDAMALLGDRWKEDLEVQKERFKDQLHTKVASYMTDEVIKASYHGAVDTLLVLKGTPLLGYYNPREDKLTITDERGSEDLLNFSAIQTIKNGGRVFLCTEEQMPEPSKLVNAVYRYAL